MNFLLSPAAIRKCLVEALENTKSLDAAVAFIGRDWADIIGTFSGPIRVICWLSSPNTNPYAVEQMMKRGNICVCHIPAMHAKVYILESRSTKCIVGSANLTAAALSEENASGQYEAAVDIGDTQKIRTVKRWFENLWNEAQPISQVDLRSAKAAWEKARSNRHGSSKKKSDSKASGEVDFPLPVDRTPHRDLVNLASKVRDWDYSKFNKYRSVLSRIVRHGREGDLKVLILFVAEWTSHAGKYRPALEEPESRIRRAFKTLFDHSNSVEDRLRELDSGGTCKIKGFGLASLTMILHWRIPTEYPPFNRRTQRFLMDFGFGGFIPKTLIPVQYGKWIAFAQELSARLDLPSSGHVD